MTLAFLSGGRSPVQERHRNGVRAGLAVRAVLVGAIGLALGYLAPFDGIEGILPFYGVFFLTRDPPADAPATGAGRRPTSRA